MRGALGMGLTWALGWGFVGGLIELTWNLWPGFPLGPLVDMWPQVLAIPGFLCGVGFSVVLRVAEGRRRFEELSLPRFAGWGALGGLLVGAVVIALGFAGAVPLWQRAAVLLGIPTLLSAVSAAGALALARAGEERAPLDAGAGVRSDAGAVSPGARASSRAMPADASAPELPRHDE